MAQIHMLQGVSLMTYKCFLLPELQSHIRQTDGLTVILVLYNLYENIIGL